MTGPSKRQKREEYRQTHREEGGNRELPKKKFYRQRAHANPFSDHQLTYPVNPSEMDWSPYYPSFIDPAAAKDVPEGQPKPLKKQVTVADIGCGFGGLLVALAPMLPDELILGLEIRTQVTEYVQDRISALRTQHSPEVENRRIVFPSWTVLDGKYVPSPVATPSLRAETKEYIVNSTAAAMENGDVIVETENRLKEILNIKTIPSYPDTKTQRTAWVANLTSEQAASIEDLQNVASITENILDESALHNGPATLYYNPAIRITSPSPPPPPYANISVLRANTMKFLPNFFTRGQLTHMFLCFPDPHFKARKHKARIVSSTLCAEYAYVLRSGGCIYTITDVEDLANWMKERLAEFGGGEMFERVEVPEEGREGEWMGGGGDGGEVARMVRCIREETEEGKKVTRNGGKKFVSVWRRREDPKWPDEVE